MESKKDSLVYVQPQEATGVWPHIEHYVAEANSYGGGKFAPYMWLSKILQNQADLFVTPGLGAAVICEPIVYPLTRVYCVVLLGGEGNHDWQSFQETFEEAAKVRQCDQIEVFGRGGWKHIMKDLGYNLAHFVWRKEV